MLAGFHAFEAHSACTAPVQSELRHRASRIAQEPDDAEIVADERVLDKTAPIQPTERVMCVVRANLRRLGFMVMDSSVGLTNIGGRPQLQVIARCEATRLGNHPPLVKFVADA